MIHPEVIRSIEGEAQSLRDRIIELQETLKWLLENDELTQYGRKTAEQALGRG